MQKIMFNDQCGLTTAVLTGHKIMTRRIVPEMVGRKYKKEPDIVWDTNDECFLVFKDNDDVEPILLYPKYKIGEVVAIAQKYIDLKDCAAFYNALEKADPTMPLECIPGEKGCYNKMFVKASWMPHQIRITNIRVERLQDISKDDCLFEGIYQSPCPPELYGFKVNRTWRSFTDARKAFAALIDKVSGRGTWESNPYVYVYEFDLWK